MEFTLYGNANDLLYVSDDGKIKSTRLCMVGADTDIENEEIIDITITSSSIDGKHNRFDELLGKEMRITVETLY